MITPTPRTVIPQPVEAADDHIGTWIRIGHGLEAAVWDAANRAKDRQDEALDAMRVSNGMTLDQFLDQK